VTAILANWRTGLRIAIELLGLICTALVVMIFALGRLASLFSGDSLVSNLLPFAGAMLALSVSVGVLLWLWVRARSWLRRKLTLLPAATAVALAAAAVWAANRPGFYEEVSNLQTMMGGTVEAERQAIAHQVFAAYRRSNLAAIEVILERARVYEPTVHEAAAAFQVDAEVLIGVGATESSFAPRASKDGGRGLFQITKIPAAAEKTVLRRLGVKKLDPWNQRHNAYLGAATLRLYLDQMGDDLFLGLLAYNIGPQNGGLKAIMTQYGAKDFVTIQPYLKNLPRDYPIRVLSAALAYRVWRAEGTLPRYEEGSNAKRIQLLGVPGLDDHRLPRLVKATS
jgi:soluble lytic murein transglycosylase-like protein